MKDRTSLLAGTMLGLSLTALPSLAQSVYTPYTFTTLAGNNSIRDASGNPIGGYADGTGSSARFNGPRGVAVDRAGNIYVAEFFNFTIRKVKPAGVVTTLAGLAGGRGSADGTGSDARFYFPSGVAVDSAGNVYVAEESNHTIRKVTAVGTNWVVTTLAGNASITNQFGNPVGGYADGTGSDARFRTPNGVATDSADNLYVADTGNHAIRKVTAVGTNWVVTTLAGNASITNQFGNPIGGYADGTGSDARFFYPYGLAVDSAGIIYVTDGENHTIRKVTPAGVVTTLAGLAGSRGSADGTGSDARFSLPFGVAVDSADSVYVADLMNHTIRKVTPAGVVTTLAGLAGSFDSTEGTGSTARFWSPSSVAMDNADSVYVGDYGNHTIRKGYPALMILSSGPGFGFNGGQFGFSLTGPTGQSAVVETSADLVNWLPLWTNTFAGDLDFSDSQSGAFSNRFYRARLP